MTFPSAAEAPIQSVQEVIFGAGARPQVAPRRRGVHLEKEQGKGGSEHSCPFKTDGGRGCEQLSRSPTLKHAERRVRLDP